MKDTNKHNDNALSLYLNEIGQIPLLQKDEAIQLAVKARNGDENAKESLVKANLRFVVAIAKKYTSHGIPLADLINEGNIGLLRAIEKFDETMGCQFITYAVFWIRQGITRAIHNKARLIRLPANKIRDLINIKKSKKKLQMSLNRDPTYDEISEDTKMNEKEIKFLLEISKDTISIESTVTSETDGPSLSDVICDETSISPEKKIEKNILIEAINSILDTLPEKEKDIIQDRFGLNGRKATCLEEIAKRYSVSRERIRQIEKKSLTKLKNNSKNIKLKAFIN